MLVLLTGFAAYIVFVFASGFLNPCAKPPRYVSRRPWRYGRKLFFTVLLGGFAATLITASGLLSLVEAVSLALVPVLVLGIIFSFRFHFART